MWWHRPTSLALWRAAVAKKERAVQEQALPQVEANGGVVKPELDKVLEPVQPLEPSQPAEVIQPEEAVQPQEAVQAEGEAMDTAMYDPCEVADPSPLPSSPPAPQAHAQAEAATSGVDPLYDLGPSDDMDITMPLQPPPEPAQPITPVTEPVAPSSPALPSSPAPSSSPAAPSAPVPSSPSAPALAPPTPLPTSPTSPPQPSTAAPGPTEAVPHPGSRHLWAGYLSSDVSESQLREAFSAFGPLEALRMLRKAGNTTALGFIHFRNTADAIACKEGLDGSTSHLGRAIKLQYQERGNYERCATLRLHNIAPAGTCALALRSCPLASRTAVSFLCPLNPSRCLRGSSQSH